MRHTDSRPAPGGGGWRPVPGAPPPRSPGSGRPHSLAAAGAGAACSPGPPAPPGSGPAAGAGSATARRPVPAGARRRRRAGSPSPGSRAPEAVPPLPPPSHRCADRERMPTPRIGVSPPGHPLPPRSVGRGAGAPQRPRRGPDRPRRAAPTECVGRGREGVETGGCAWRRRVREAGRCGACTTGLTTGPVGGAAIFAQGGGGCMVGVTIGALWLLPVVRRLGGRAAGVWGTETTEAVPAPPAQIRASEVSPQTDQPSESARPTSARGQHATPTESASSRLGVSNCRVQGDGWQSNQPTCVVDAYHSAQPRQRYAKSPRYSFSALELSANASAAGMKSSKVRSGSASTS